MSDHRTPDAPGLWKAAHGGYGVMFHDDGEPAMLLFGPGAKVRALDAIGPYTRLQPGVPVGSAPVPNLPGLWMDKDGSLYFLSDGRRVWRIRDNREWMGEEIEEQFRGIVHTMPIHTVFNPSRRRGPVEAGLRRFHSDS